MAFSPNAVLPDEQSAYLQNIVALLEQLVSNNGLCDPNRRTRVAVETIVALPANQSTNIAQWNGQATVSGVGAGGNGAPRVTPSTDTLAGVGAVTQIPQAWNNAPLAILYANIAVS